MDNYKGNYDQQIESMAEAGEILCDEDDVVECQRCTIIIPRELANKTHWEDETYYTCEICGND